jgi:predicted nucleotidyltransferase
MPLKETYTKDIKLSVTRMLPNARVFIFGSQVMGTSRQDSDCDVAIDAGHILSFSEIGALRENFENSDLPFSVDLIDIRATSPDFLARISQHWQEI